MFSLFNFSSVSFPGGRQLTPFAPMCGRPWTRVTSCNWAGRIIARRFSRVDAVNSLRRVFFSIHVRMNNAGATTTTTTLDRLRAACVNTRLASRSVGRSACPRRRWTAIWRADPMHPPRRTAALRAATHRRAVAELGTRAPGRPWTNIQVEPSLPFLYLVSPFRSLPPLTLLHPPPHPSLLLTSFPSLPFLFLRIPNPFLRIPSIPPSYNGKEVWGRYSILCNPVQNLQIC